MTYYDLIKFLYSIVEKPIDYKNIEFLNSVNIELKGERYQRFLDQMSVVVSDRISNAISNIKEKLVGEYLDTNTLTIEASLIRNEIKYCLDLCKCLLIQPENQSEFVNSIVETNNDLVDVLKNFFDDDERIMIINSLYLKEEEV